MIKRYIYTYSIFFVILVYVFMNLWEGSIKSPPVDDGFIDGKKVTIKGVTDKKYKKNANKIIELNKADLFFENRKINSEKIGLIVYLNNEQNLDCVKIGSEILIEGSFVAYECVTNEGQFDLKKYYEIHGINGKIYSGRIVNISETYNHFKEALFCVRENTSEIYNFYIGEKYAGILDALVLGDKTHLDEEVKEQYQHAGCSHILALSGLHIATVGLLIYKILKSIRFGKWFSGLVSITIIFAYVVMTGCSISAVRAFIMFALGIIADFCSRTLDLKTSGALAADLILVNNPMYIFDSGFLLSFSALIGIGIFYPCLRQIMYLIFSEDNIKNLKRSKNKVIIILMKAYETLIFGISIQLSTLPMVMYFFFEIPVFGIITNLFILPLAAFVLGLGISIAILGNLYALSGFIPFEILLKVITFFEKIILGFYDFVTKGINELPVGVYISGQPEKWQIFVYYFSFLCLSFVVEKIWKKENRDIFELSKNKPNKKYGLLKQIYKNYLKFGCVFAGILLMVIAFQFVRFDADMGIYALYIGQGGCTVIRDKNGSSYIYDCGSFDEKKIGEYKVIPFLKSKKISKINVFFVSHMDSDHLSGLLEMLESDNGDRCKGSVSGIAVEKIVIPKGKIQRESENYKKLISLARMKGISVYDMGVDDVLEERNFIFEALSPKHEVADINDGSLVLNVKYAKDNIKFNALFTGDISAEIEDELVDEAFVEKLPSAFEYLQVAHHGSKTASTSRFLKRIKPKIAVISAGVANKYGHPHKETLDNLEKVGAISLCTNLSGEVCTEIRGNNIFIREFKNPASY